MNVILTSIIIQIKQAITRPMFRFCVLVNPIISGFLLGMMYRNKSVEDFMIYAFIGAGISVFWGSICFSSASDIEREKWFGTLPVIFTSPAGFEKIIIGKILGNTFWGIFSVFLNMATVYIFFGIPLQFNNFSFFLLIFTLMILSMISLGFMLCGLFTLSRKVRVFMNIMDYPIIILTGMVFPIAIFPKFIQVISHILSPTWAMKGFRISVLGGSKEEMLVVVLALITITLIYSFISFISFRKIKERCVINGTLEVF